MSAKVLTFPTRPPPETGALLGAASARQTCPVCSTALQAFRAYWTPNEAMKGHWLCPTCNEVYGPPARTMGLAAIDLQTGGAPGAPLTHLPTASGRPLGHDVFHFEAWVTEDGLVRLTNGATKNRNLDASRALTAAEVTKLSRDFADLARAAKQQQERLRGDDRWRARPCPDRPGVYLVKRLLWAGKHREVPFVSTVLRKRNYCEVCRYNAAPGATMYREEKPEPWANPSWRHVRICSPCISRVDGGSPS